MTREEFAALTDVSRETLERFEIWRRLLEEWSAHTNLVARSTLPDFWSRHAYDSFQLVDHVPDAARRCADIGAGAGFPGLAIAFALMARNPGEARVYLIESIGKKARFLQAVADATDAPVEVLPIRSEAVDPALTVDIVTARAVAALPKLLTICKPLLKTGTLALFLKGARYEEELTEARKYWSFDAEVIPSLTGDGAILKLETIAHV
tara:strand:- start:2727 stop:3350 length:624 start_codon:yes stop_codon:yes gene_type:complete